MTIELSTRAGFHTGPPYKGNDMLLSERAKRVGKRELVKGQWQRKDMNGDKLLCNNEADSTGIQYVPNIECRACRDRAKHTQEFHDEAVMNAWDMRDLL